ncbi:eukaryotic translation initiation factor 5B-like isoform X2 [Ctenocephalides felis]|uniref:eukaryotic translation initiation factor 5B-like isoform X2 n=1 Tax=Ctenocephalides felis TaxID=7515 RepID=UPI000E6E4967|nr:eukaryotic translation initiation factor 5B-like isoform X2 [Ctenocephalides felis]
MGKAKKLKKNANDDELDSDIDTTDAAVKETTKGKTKSKPQEKIIDSDNEDTGKKKKSSKKDKKKKVVDNDSDVDDITNEIDDLNIHKEIEKPKAKKPDIKKGGFALLAVEDSAESAPSDNEISESTTNTSSKNKKANKKIDRSDSIEDNKPKPDGGKKSKKSKKKRNDSEEDIEKVLAELELEYSGVKKDVKEEENVGKVEKVAQVEKQAKPSIKTEIKDQSEVKDDTNEESGGTVKTAAQKKKEKKEREKQKKLQMKQKEVKPVNTDQSTKSAEESSKQQVETVAGDDDENKQDDAEEDDDKKKKKKKGAKAAEDAKAAGKGPGKKTIAAMQDALKKLREEQEKLQREEEERIRKEEEAEAARLEQIRLEQERKEKKKKKEKERKERLKAEGKLLSAKQKADKARAQAMLESLKARGLEMPEVGEKKPRLGTRIRPNKSKQQGNKESTEVQSQVDADKVGEQPAENVVEQSAETKAIAEEDDVKDAWDADSSSEEESTTETPVTAKSETKVDQSAESKKEETSSEEESEEESDSESESESSEDSDNRTDAEKKREKALQRIQKRRIDAEQNKSLDKLRAAVVCVLGHVDTGKTKILDKLRRTNVQDGEAGGITQQIGATNVPIENIKEQVKIVKGISDTVFKIPGLLIIDTPGHESFSNLRSRGSSLCDIAILVVDIMHGLEPQTLESINLLKTKKTPFIVALNKIDRLYDWSTMARKDVRDVLKAQAPNTQLEFEQRTKEIIVQFAEQGLNAALFHENPDPRSYVSLVPTSAITGEGMGNLLALIVDSCQNMLAKRLMFSEDLQATVLEVKAIPGHGTTIDAILINGTLREGDTIILAGTDGPIVTQIRSLLMPQPMKELRVKNAYIEHKEVVAAQGVKIAAKELEKAIAGLNLQVAQKPDEIDIFRDEVAKELKSALSGIKLQERGVYVQASTLGSLEALLEFLKVSKIPYAGIRIGPVVKRDVMKASTMLEHDSQYATILAFDVKIERDAQELADTLGVKIFQADIIYHLFDKFTAYRDELKQRKRDEFKNIAVFPCKLKVLPQYVFNSRDPIVMGVMVEAGIVKEGTPICVPSKDFVDLGIVTSIESNHKQVESARKGLEVCVKIEPIPGEAPKMFGRHFDETDFLVSKISRQSIDACKDYFREDLVKTDWQLMVELKKLFQIL